MSIFPTKILLAADGSEVADLAAKTAATLATRANSELHVVHVGPGLPLYELPDYPARFEDEVKAQRQEAQRVLDEQVRKVEGSGATVKEAHLEMDERPDRAIVELAEELGVGLMVVGSRGLGGLRRTLMGSVSDSVVRHSHCPVLVVRGEPLTFPTKLLLATDGSVDAQLAAQTAADLANKTDSELHIVHVRPRITPHYPGYYIGPEVVENAEEKEQRYLDREAQRLLDTQVEQVSAAGGSVAQFHLRSGKPEEEIVSLAEELGARLIVLGSRGRGGVRRALMGSVSDSIVRHAHCPVMVVRREEERST
jgi:nucleotide-binding universal stress UspA family protein